MSERKRRPWERDPGNENGTTAGLAAPTIVMFCGYLFLGMCFNHLYWTEHKQVSALVLLGPCSVSRTRYFGAVWEKAYRNEASNFPSSKLILVLCFFSLELSHLRPSLDLLNLQASMGRGGGVEGGRGERNRTDIIYLHRSPSHKLIGFVATVHFTAFCFHGTTKLLFFPRMEQLAIICLRSQPFENTA